MRRYIVVIALALCLLFSFSGSVLAAEQQHPTEMQNALCAGANLDVNSDCSTYGVTTQQQNQNINKLIHSVINWLSLVVGVVAVIMIIVGGLRYITSGGSDTSVTGAKNTILYAIIGLVIVALAQVLVHFILSKVVNV